LDQVKIKVSNDSTKPQPVTIVADATFFERTYGVIVFREPNLRKNLYWKEITIENLSAYWQGKTFLEKKGFTIQAAVTDGKRCARAVFSDIPTQMCHFHQILIITKYLTKRSKLEAGKELRMIALTLTKSNEKEFTILLSSWFEKWKEFLKKELSILKPANGFTLIKD